MDWHRACVRVVRLAAAAAVVLALAGCISDPSECSLGCPVGWHCAANRVTCERDVADLANMDEARPVDAATDLADSARPGDLTPPIEAGIDLAAPVDATADLTDATVTPDAPEDRAVPPDETVLADLSAD